MSLHKNFTTLVLMDMHIDTYPAVGLSVAGLFQCFLIGIDSCTVNQFSLASRVVWPTTRGTVMTVCVVTLHSHACKGMFTCNNRQIIT